MKNKIEESLTKELMQIFRVISIQSPTSFTIAGKNFSLSGQAVQLQKESPPSQIQLTTLLQQQLYHYCYCQKFKSILVDIEANLTPEDNFFVQSLSKANQGIERWEAGWQINKIEPSGQIFAHKSGLTRMLWPGEYISDVGPGMIPKEGMSIRIFCAKESFTLQPGFYFVFSETLADQQDDYSVVRFYWNIGDAGVSRLISLITVDLNRFQVPFKFKCLNNRAQYNRLDPAVLYISKRYYRITVELLLNLYSQIEDYLEKDTPLFTKQLAFGLGFAEDPGQGESFGMNRCRMIAEGIWNAYSQGSQTEHSRIEALSKLFLHYGISLEHPYLNAGSHFEYEFPTYQK